MEELLPSLRIPDIENILGSENERMKNSTISAINLSEGTDVAGEDSISFASFAKSELSYISTK